MENLKGLTFEEVVVKCYDNDSFVKEFNRLTGENLKKPVSGIMRIVDKACNYNPNEKGLKIFIRFVEEYIWNPIIMK